MHPVSRPSILSLIGCRISIASLVLLWALVATPEKAISEPGPVALDPAIVDLLTEVSTDSLVSYVESLQGFHTRNTGSDTLSATTGIGAARRWLHDKYLAEGLTAGYFDWEAEICDEDRVHRNTLGTITGGWFPDRLIYVGGHLDSRGTDTCNTTGYAPGANDDGSGIACLIELARLLPSLGLESSVTLIGFAGEEQGLQGSEAMSAAALQDGDEIIAMFNNDTIGNIDGCPGVPDCGGGPTTDEDSTSVRIFSGGPTDGVSRQLARLAKLIGEAYNDEMLLELQDTIDRPGRGGDHIPFHETGFPAIRFIETLEYTLQQHNTNDIINHMEFSYLAQNVRINLAVIANVALAPPTPTGVEVFDLGTGGATRATWDPVTGVPDLAGYRVAYRTVSEGDTLYYADVLDAGAALTFDITGLTDEVELAVSVSAYDTEGHESVFSRERTVTPGVVPHSVPGFTAVSKPDRVELFWDPPQELDLTRIRIARSLSMDSGFSILDSVDATITSYVDTQVMPDTDYFYELTSVDIDGFVSDPTDPDKGRRTTLEFGFLVVDATKDGNGGIGSPSDAQVDDYYEDILASLPVLDTWDYPANLADGVLLTDADMGRYRTVFFHSDVRAGQLAADTLEIRQYLENGGQVFLGGWNLKGTVAGVADEFAPFGPGDFFHDIFGIDSLRTALNGESDFNQAQSLGGGYPDLDVDSGKWPFSGGNLIFADAIFGEVGGEGTPIYSYNSSADPPGPNDGRPVGLRISSRASQAILLTAPLYFIEQSDAEGFVAQMAADLGYGTTDLDLSTESSGPGFRSHPNPFRDASRLSFRAAAPEAASLRVFDVSGREVRTLLDTQRLEAGTHLYQWDGTDQKGHRVGTGVYYAVLRLGDTRETRELILVR